jgi:hypothetical protein
LIEEQAMNEIIKSLGGVLQINADIPANASDAQLTQHLANDLILAAGRQPVTVAEVRAQQAWLAADATKKSVEKQIKSLEESVTDRRYREAVLGIDNGWLTDLNAQIKTLREQLV